jgi:hypothetical protein
MDIFQEFTFEDIVKNAIAIVVIFSALISIMYVIWWGLLLIVSGGSEEKVKSAINHIRHAVIGIFFMLWVLFILPVLMNLFGIPYAEYAKPSEVFITMQQIFDYIFWTSVADPLSPQTTDTLPADFSDF